MAAMLQTPNGWVPGQHRDFRNCAGFRTPAMTGSPRADAAGVRKAPRHEIAVGSAPGGAACAMGIWPRREGWRGWTEVFELIAFSQSIGVCAAVKQRRVGCAPR